MQQLLITGAGGFVGSRLAAAFGPRACGLVRADPGPVAWHPIRGDLLDPGSWVESLSGVSTVVHLAALTGKAPAADHQRVNVEGTRCLLNACEHAGVAHFVFVSSVAVQFDDLTRYPYAQAKQQAEALVAAAGLHSTILRPTMILGAGSPILTALQRLAAIPLMPIFGHGRTHVQPVHVDDVVQRLMRLVETPPVVSTVVGCGGPETLPIEALLRRIRKTQRGSAGPAVHVPLGLLLPLLALGESIAFGAMPFTVGQMATFRFDGTVPADAGGTGEELRSIATMIGEVATP